MTSLTLRPYQAVLPPRIHTRLVVQRGPLPTRCIVWSGHLVSGYASARWKGHERKLHKAIYELFVGKVPNGLTLDHLCRVRNCVRVEHLEPVTQRVNILRGVGLAAREVLRTRCPSGHPYNKENTYRLPSRPTARYCRECNRIGKRRRRAAKKAAA